MFTVVHIYTTLDGTSVGLVDAFPPLNQPLFVQLPFIHHHNDRLGFFLPT